MLIINGDVVNRLSEASSEYAVLVIGKTDVKLYKFIDGRYIRATEKAYVIKDKNRDLVAIKTKKYVKVIPLSAFTNDDYQSIQDNQQVELSNDADHPMYAYSPQWMTPCGAQQQVQTTQQWGVPQKTAQQWAVPQTNQQWDGQHVGQQARQQRQVNRQVRQLGRRYGPNSVTPDTVPGDPIVHNAGPIFGPAVGVDVPGRVFAQAAYGTGNLSRAYDLQNTNLNQQRYNVQNGQPFIQQRYNFQQNYPGMDVPNPMTRAIATIQNNTGSDITIPANFSTRGQQQGFQIKFPAGSVQPLNGHRLNPGAPVAFQLPVGNGGQMSYLVGRLGMDINTVYVSRSSVPIGMGGYFRLPTNQQFYMYRSR